MRISSNLITNVSHQDLHFFWCIVFALPPLPMDERKFNTEFVCDRRHSNMEIIIHECIPGA